MQEQIQKVKKKSILWGIFGGVALISIYFIIVSLANSVSHAITEFWDLWYWITALVVGFGIQVGLFAHMRQTIKLKEELKGATTSMAAGAGVSTASMIACCAHHVSDVLPILGLSAAAAFLTQYQLVFIIVGIISNILGVTYMLSIITKHRLYFDSNKWLTRLANYNYKKVFQIEVPVLSIAFLIGLFFFSQSPEVSSEVIVSNQQSEVIVSNQQPVVLENRAVQGNGISVIVNGEYQPSQGKIIFKMRINTHSGSLDYPFEKISTLIINDKKISSKASWTGSPPGGHHRSGQLTFSNVPGNAKRITLEISGEGRMGTRKFTWDLENGNKQNSGNK